MPCITNSLVSMLFMILIAVVANCLIGNEMFEVYQIQKCSKCNGENIDVFCAIKTYSKDKENVIWIVNYNFMSALQVLWIATFYKFIVSFFNFENQREVIEWRKHVCVMVSNFLCIIVCLCHEEYVEINGTLMHSIVDSLTGKLNFYKTVSNENEIRCWKKLISPFWIVCLRHIILICAFYSVVSLMQAANSITLRKTDITQTPMSAHIEGNENAVYLQKVKPDRKSQVVKLKEMKRKNKKGH